MPIAHEYSCRRVVRSVCQSEEIEIASGMISKVGRVPEAQIFPMGRPLDFSKFGEPDSVVCSVSDAATHVTFAIHF